MAPRTVPLVARYKSFVNDLVSVEKRQIVALTEIAKDAVISQPELAPQLAQVIIDRALQAPADVKLPILYLLDSITKNVGEPFKTCFAAALPQIYSDAWTVGAPGLHKPLQKLAATWIGVFPPHVLRAVHASVSVTNAPRQQLVDSSQRKPMVKDPRLGSDVPGGMVGQENIAVGDILSALAASGTLNAVFSRSQGTVPSTSLHSSETTKSLELKSDLIKEKNPAAIMRLLNATRKNQSIFLDNKFLKRKAQDASLRRSRMWYVDLETWMKGSMRLEEPSQQSQVVEKKAALERDIPNMSVPVDESQTHCAISGEKFEKFWDDAAQEWRYADTIRVTEKMAPRLGVPSGSLVLSGTVDFSRFPEARNNGAANGEQPETKKIKTES